jgi:hypothetical protein
LPVSRAPVEQVASTKKPNEAALTKPLAMVLGLSLGPQKPVYRAFTLGPATPVSTPAPAPAPAKSAAKGK